MPTILQTSPFYFFNLSWLAACFICMHSDMNNIEEELCDACSAGKEIDGFNLDRVGTQTKVCNVFSGVQKVQPHLK